MSKIKYKEGDCIQHIKPYDGEPEKMILERISKQFPDCYLVVCVENGELGYREFLPHKDVNKYYRLQD